MTGLIKPDNGGFDKMMRWYLLIMVTLFVIAIVSHSLIIFIVAAFMLFGLGGGSG